MTAPPPARPPRHQPPPAATSGAAPEDPLTEAARALTGEIRATHALLLALRDAARR